MLQEKEGTIEAVVLDVPVFLCFMVMWARLWSEEI